MRISDWSSDVCSSDLTIPAQILDEVAFKPDPEPIRGLVIDRTADVQDLELRGETKILVVGAGGRVERIGHDVADREHGVAELLERGPRRIGRADQLIILAGRRYLALDIAVAEVAAREPHRDLIGRLEVDAGLRREQIFVLALIRTDRKSTR